MKTWIDKLRGISTGHLKSMIKQQKQDIKIKQRDLEIMERVLAERNGEEAGI